MSPPLYLGQIMQDRRSRISLQYKLPCPRACHIKQKFPIGYCADIIRCQRSINSQKVSSGVRKALIKIYTWHSDNRTRQQLQKHYGCRRLNPTAPEPRPDQVDKY